MIYLFSLYLCLLDHKAIETYSLFCTCSVVIFWDKDLNVLWHSVEYLNFMIKIRIKLSNKTNYSVWRHHILEYFKLIYIKFRSIFHLKIELKKWRTVPQLLTPFLCTSNEHKKAHYVFDMNKLVQKLEEIVSLRSTGLVGNLWNINMGKLRTLITLEEMLLTMIRIIKDIYHLNFFFFFQMEDWLKQPFRFIIVICQTNTFLAYKYFKNGKLNNEEFTPKIRFTERVARD